MNKLKRTIGGGVAIAILVLMGSLGMASDSRAAANCAAQSPLAGELACSHAKIVLRPTYEQVAQKRRQCTSWNDCKVTGTYCVAYNKYGSCTGFAPRCLVWQSYCY